MSERRDNVAMAHRIATMLYEAGYRDHDGCVVLAIALGIYAEGIDADRPEGSPRFILPLVKALHDAGQQTFDALRAGRNRKPGHA